MEHAKSSPNQASKLTCTDPNDCVPVCLDVLFFGATAVVDKRAHGLGLKDFAALVAWQFEGQSISRKTGNSHRTVQCAEKLSQYEFLETHYGSYIHTYIYIRYKHMYVYLLKTLSLRHVLPHLEFPSLTAKWWGLIGFVEPWQIYWFHVAYVSSTRGFTMFHIFSTSQTHNFWSPMQPWMEVQLIDNGS